MKRKKQDEATNESSFSRLKGTRTLSIRSVLLFVFYSILAFAFLSLLTALIFYQRLDTLSTHYTMPDVDTDSGLWYQWYLSSLDERNAIYEVTDLTAYPVGFDISTSPIQNIIYDLHVAVLKHIGFSWSNLMLVSNISALLVYPLSGVTAAWLSYYLLRNKKLSLLFGFMYAFAFYIIYMGRGSMSINHIELIPLVFLSIFYYLDRKTTFVLLISCGIIALQFKADPYYAFWSCMFMPLIVALYKKETMRSKATTLFIFTTAIIVATGMSNYSYVSQQFEIMTSSDLLKQTGRNSDPLQELGELASTFSLPVPTYNVLRYLAHGVSTLLYLPIIVLPIISITLLIKQNRIQTFAICWLVSVVLSVYIPPLFWINEVYFRIFGMFRGVGRLSHFSTLFGGLLAVTALDFYEKKYSLSKNGWYVTGLLIFAFLYLVGNLNTDVTWSRTTNFAEIEKLYSPLNLLDVTAIASYPFELSSGTTGFPIVYQLLAQVVHQKPLASGLNVFTAYGSQAHQDALNDITNPNLISNLGAYGINTIVIYNKLQSNAQEIVKNLQADSRLTFIGRFTANTDGSYLSASDLSRDISVFQIADEYVDRIRRDSSIVIEPDSSKYKIMRHNKYLSEIILPSTVEELDVNYLTSYSPRWKLVQADDLHIYSIIIGKKGTEVAQVTSEAAMLKNSWRITDVSPHIRRYVLYFDGYRQILIGKFIETTFGVIFGLAILLFGFKDLYFPATEKHQKRVSA